MSLFGKKFRIGLVTLMLFGSVQPSLAIDPLYQPQMQRLLFVIGSLYFLGPTCGYKQNDWRQHAADLIAVDNPTDDRRQRLMGSFNEGYQAYSRLYNGCTGSAEQATGQLLVEAEQLAREIHNRFAE